MYKINLPLNRCISGMVLAEPVIDIDTGLVILGKDSILTDTTITNMSKFNYSTICVYIGAWNNVWNVSAEVIEKYETHKRQLKNILEHMTIEQVANAQEIREIAKDISVNFNANYTILSCINMVKLADEYTYTHSINVALLSMLIGRWMKYSEEDIEKLILLGLVHDIGKEQYQLEHMENMTILSEEQFEGMKKNILYSYEILENVKSYYLNLTAGLDAYQLNNEGNAPLEHLKKVLIIADIYDAITTHRIYSKRQSPFDSLELMQKGVFGKLDTEILLTFVNNMSTYYVGVYVLLSTGEVGEVVFIHPHCVYRPIVRVGDAYIDLYKRSDIKILQIA